MSWESAARSRCKFAREGAEVVVNDLGVATDGTGSSRIADEVVAEIAQAGGKAVANYDSVATVEGGKRIVAAAIEAFGRCDILVNNAGILRDKTLYNMEEADWDAVIAVHLKGTTAARVRSCATSKTRSAWTAASSTSRRSRALFGNFGQANYGAAKAGIAGFSRVIAKELAKFRCTVNTISPGAATRMTIPLAEARGETVDATEFKRGPQQIAPVVTWLASEAAKDLNAQILHVSRGTVGIMQQPPPLSRPPRICSRSSHRAAARRRRHLPLSDGARHHRQERLPRLVRAAREPRDGAPREALLGLRDRRRLVHQGARARAHRRIRPGHAALRARDGARLGRSPTPRAPVAT